jgi:hypothetical protein
MSEAKPEADLQIEIMPLSAAAGEARACGGHSSRATYVLRAGLLFIPDSGRCLTAEAHHSYSCARWAR